MEPGILLPELLDKFMLLDTEPECGGLAGTKADHFLVLKSEKNTHLNKEKAEFL